MRRSSSLLLEVLLVLYENTFWPFTRRPSCLPPGDLLVSYEKTFWSSTRRRATCQAKVGYRTHFFDLFQFVYYRLLLLRLANNILWPKIVVVLFLNYLLLLFFGVCFFLPRSCLWIFCVCIKSKLFAVYVDKAMPWNAKKMNLNFSDSLALIRGDFFRIFENETNRISITNNWVEKINIIFFGLRRLPINNFHFSPTLNLKPTNHYRWFSSRDLLFLLF